MLVIGTFEHSIELEECLLVVENTGISRQHILVIPMDTHPPPALEQYLASQSDRHSRGIETGMALATAASVIGTSVGFKLAWGPIFSGLTAAVLGFIIGFGLYRLTTEGTYQQQEKLPEVNVIVQCNEDQSTLIVSAMWRYNALSVARTREAGHP